MAAGGRANTRGTTGCMSDEPGGGGAGSPQRTGPTPSRCALQDPGLFLALQGDSCLCLRLTLSPLRLRLPPTNTQSASGPGSPCGSQPPEIPGKSDPAGHSDEIRKRRKAQGVRVPDPMTHSFGPGSDFSEASTPGGRAVRRAEEPSAKFACPANWTA